MAYMKRTNFWDKPLESMFQANMVLWIWKIWFFIGKVCR